MLSLPLSSREYQRFCLLAKYKCLQILKDQIQNGLALREETMEISLSPSTPAGTRREKVDSSFSQTAGVLPNPQK